tara:strand:- start:53 stop:322 length:270 start_codon:yes stop_codon:yes gene_type:complete
VGPAARPPAPSHIAAFRRARASRDPGRVAAKLNAWPGLLPLLLKAVRLTLAATKGGPSISGELRSALASLKADLQAQAEAMVALLQLKS